MKLLIIIVSMIFCIPIGAQTLKGRITDVRNEPLPFANIWLSGTTKGITSNGDGYFEWPLKAENRKDTVVFAFVGYETLKIAVNTLNFEKELHVMLNETGMSLQQITIVARRPVSEDFSMQRLDKMDIYQNPTANADPLKAIAMLPASTATDESANPSLRGSAADRTRVILNGVPVYNPVRLSNLSNIGVFSLFSTHLVQNEYVYASNPPLSYGNVTAGIVEIETATKQNTNTAEISAGLGNAGFLLSRKIKSSDNFVQIYGNCFYGNMLTALNSKSIPRLNGYTVFDGGLNLHIKLGKQTSMNLYSYAIDEYSDYRMNMFAYEKDAVKKERRIFNIISFRWFHGRHLVSLNHGNDFSKEHLKFGNMMYQPQSKSYYSSGSYKYVGDKFNVQAGASHEFARYHTNHSRIPRYYYALMPESPVWICDSTLKNQSLEMYAYAKSDVSKKIIISGGIRSNLPMDGETMYISRQIGVKYRFSDRSSLLLAAGKYHGRGIPNYYNLMYLPQTATHYSLDYNLQTEQTTVQAAIYYKTETGNYTSNYIDHSDQRKISGAEVSAEQTVFRWFTLSGSYTYLHATQHTKGNVFTSYNSLPYIFKATASFQKLNIGTFAFSYISRPGVWFTPIIGGVYHPHAGCFAPEFADINSQRMTAYHRVDFTANKIFIVGKNSIIGYFAINNILNIKNECNRIYSSDYSDHKNEFFNGRLVYFGVMVGW